MASSTVGPGVAMVMPEVIANSSNVASVMGSGREGRSKCTHKAPV